MCPMTVKSLDRQTHYADREPETEVMWCPRPFSESKLSQGEVPILVCLLITPAQTNSMKELNVGAVWCQHGLQG